MTKIETRVFTYSTKLIENNENKTICIRCKVLKDPADIFFNKKKQIINAVVDKINDKFWDVNIGYKTWGFELIVFPSEQTPYSALNFVGNFIEKEFGKEVAKYIKGDSIIRCGKDSDQASIFVVE